MTLRDYQQQMSDEMFAALESGANPLGVLPTGGGKSVILTDLADRLIDQDQQVVIVTHRVEIRDQLVKHAAARGLDAELIEASPRGAKNRQPTDWSAPLIVGMVATLDRRRDTIPTSDQRVSIFDEAHHICSDSWSRVQRALGPRCSGFTATPIRPDGCLVSKLTELRHLVLGPEPRELIERGFLSRYRYIVAENLINVEGVGTRAGDFIASQLAGAASQLGGDVVKAWKRYNPDAMPTLAACCNISHAESVAALYQEAGISSAVIHGKLPLDERRQMLQALADGEIKVLTSVAVIEEGVDVPALSCLQMLRPTRSLRLKRQLEGRALRPMPGKESALILDHTSNLQSLPLPCEPIDWRTKEVVVPSPRTKFQRIERNPTTGVVEVREMTKSEMREVFIDEVIAARKDLSSREDGAVWLALQEQIKRYEAGQIKGPELGDWLFSQEHTAEAHWKEVARVRCRPGWTATWYREWKSANAKRQAEKARQRKLEAARAATPTAAAALSHLIKVELLPSRLTWLLSQAATMSCDADVLDLTVVIDERPGPRDLFFLLPQLNKALAGATCVEEVGRCITVTADVRVEQLKHRSAEAWEAAWQWMAASLELPSRRAWAGNCRIKPAPGGGAILEVAADFEFEVQSQLYEWCCRLDQWFAANTNEPGAAWLQVEPVESLACA